MTSIESRGNLAPILVATAAFGGPALINTASVESAQRPAPHVRDIGALPTARAFEAPMLEAGESGLPKKAGIKVGITALSNATVTRLEQNANASQNINDPIARLASYERNCKFHAVLYPGKAGGRQDYVPNKKNWSIHARANVDGMNRGTWSFKLRNAKKCFSGLVVSVNNVPHFPKPKRKNGSTWVYTTTEPYYEDGGIEAAGFFATSIKRSK